MKSISLKRGFTLIELLVVIAIIGILAAVILASLNTARAKARDARRISDIRTIQTALEMYYSDNGSYPISNGASGCATYTTVPNNSWCNSAQKNSNGRWIANGALAPYLAQDPVDPQPDTLLVWNDGSNSDGGAYFYLALDYVDSGCAAGQKYFLIAGMEIVSNRKNTYKACNGSTYTAGGTYIVGSSVQ
ncbi:prepilin-type N-terminal cleavage/methylation domain-containing protein [Patescibacteria group bacterium]|nr:prepilin-type N-terminal cleavage/methylation domain-containing protein [Patescibacteria group bacterium]